MNDWQPIETAPRDGTPVQLYRPPCTGGTWSRVPVARWIEADDCENEVNAWCWPSDVEDEFMDHADFLTLVTLQDVYEDASSFTHWRPLPDPPE